MCDGSEWKSTKPDVEPEMDRAEMRAESLRSLLSGTNARLAPQLWYWSGTLAQLVELSSMVIIS
jgi:hypothetical protein